MSPTNKILVVIDLQNEFLTPDGRYPILQHCKDALFTTLTKLVPEFRNQGHIIWVKSIYNHLGDGADEDDTAEPPSNSARGSEWKDRDVYLAGTHKGKSPCCEEGSVNAQFHPTILELVNGSDTQMTKTNYSAFNNTSLLSMLRSHSATNVYFCGLLSNTCVLATLIDAVQLPGFNIHVVSDCLGWRKEKSHLRALERMKDMGVNVADSNEILADNPVNAKLTRPELYYVNGSIPSWRVQIALSEKGVEVSQVRLKVMTHPKPTRLPAFLALNPRGKTPVFIDTDDERTTVNESLAILGYLEMYYGEKALLPPLDQRKYRARILSLIQETENLHNTYDALEDAFFNAQITDTMSNFTSNIRPALLKDLDRELVFWENYAMQSSGYIGGGDDFTLADCAFYPILGYMLRRGFEFNARWPGLGRYYSRVWARDSAKLSQPEGWFGKGNTDIFHGS
ncbi:Isochorismatase-like protein [Hygrophoropsis aurantiaca]|uniref:Isochorismatase-like protein n=1 Tax=Hygrophoropsis aurantiaca TaxID=72124 RepID=A0ACB7ZY58_9AGAM|nr:Isochorismatase-like protein [Hygrophoropsis aurantiaca]